MLVDDVGVGDGDFFANFETAGGSNSEQVVLVVDLRLSRGRAVMIDALRQVGSAHDAPDVTCLLDGFAQLTANVGQTP